MPASPTLAVDVPGSPTESPATPDMCEEDRDKEEQKAWPVALLCLFYPCCFAVFLVLC